MLNHQAEEWARGIHSTNSIEGFWSHLKRGISSTHVSISKKHTQKYVDEFSFRYNNRHTPADMFARMLKQVSTPNKWLILKLISKFQIDTAKSKNPPKRVSIL